MKTRLLALLSSLGTLLLLLLAAPSATAQPAAAGEAPAMLADMEDEVSAAHLKLLRKKTVTLKPRAAPAPAGVITLQADGLRIRVRVSDLAAARSAAPKVQQKYTRAMVFLGKAVKANQTTIELNQYATRDLEHLLAVWALPQGRVVDVTWQGQPVTTYQLEAYGGGPNQKVYPEGQVFYYYPTDRAAGFYVYMNVPKPK